MLYMQSVAIQKKQLPIASRDRTEFVSQSNVFYLEAYDNYCLIHLKEGKRKIVSRCLKHILTIVNPNQFLKIHRKYAVNINHIDSINFSTSRVLLNCGVALNIARSRKKMVKNWANIYSERLEIAS